MIAGSERVKVLHIITGLSQGGAERQLANLVSICSEGALVFSLTGLGAAADEIRKVGVPVITGGERRGVSLKVIAKLREAIVDSRPDLVMGWMYHANLAALLTRWFGHRGPIVWNVRHSVYDVRREKASTRLVIRAGAWFAGSPARVIYNSEIAAKQHERLGYPFKKRVVLPNGFDLQRFKPDSQARQIQRASLGIPPSRFLLGVVGRSHPMKNHLGWLKALQMLVDKGLPVHCVMVGTAVANPDGTLAIAIRAASLESYITLLPPTNSPELLYPALDLLVMPSLWGEGFPNVVGEAMACGVPAVVTDVGDAVMVVGETGFVSESGSPAHLATEVQSALTNGREGLTRLGLMARERIVESYGSESMANGYRSLYGDLTGDRTLN